MKAAVVGGGLAGLAAAYELAGAGARVTVFEKYPQAGGLAAAFPLGGTHLERFYHHIFSTDLDLLQLIDELGLAPKLRWHPEFNGSWHKGRIYPFSPAWRILTFSALGLLDRLRLALASKYLSLLRDHRRFEAVTARDWITRAMGRRVWELLWEPLFCSKFGAHADQVGMTWFFGRIKARFGPSRKGAPQGCLGYLEGSTQVLADALLERLKARGVELRCSHPVRRLLAEGGRVAGVESKSGEERFDAVLATNATPEFLAIAGDILPAGLRASLGQFKYHGSIVAVLELPESLSPVYWLNVLDKDLPFLAIIEQTRMIPPQHYGGRHVVYLAKYLDPDSDFYRLGNAEVLKDYYLNLRKVFPAFDESRVLAAHVMRAEHTQPIVTLGYGARIPPHRLPLKGLYLANMTQIYPEDRGMSYSVGMGRRVAKLMLEDADALTQA